MYKYVNMLLIAIIFLSGCNSGITINPIEKVVIYEMESFQEKKQESRIEINEVHVIESIVKGVQTAERQKGIVNIASPHYSMIFQGKHYFLWVDDQSGTVMDAADTHTIYALSKSAAEIIQRTIAAASKPIRVEKRTDKGYTTWKTVENTDERKKITEILSAAQWEHAEVQMAVPPTYRFRFQSSFYAVWLTPKGNIEIIVEDQGKYIKLSIEDSATFLSIINQ